MKVDFEHHADLYKLVIKAIRIFGSVLTIIFLIIILSSKNVAALQ